MGWLRLGTRNVILFALAAVAVSAGLAAAPQPGAQPQTQPTYEDLARARFEVADKAYQQINDEYRKGLLGVGTCTIGYAGGSRRG